MKKTSKIYCMKTIIFITILSLITIAANAQQQRREILNELNSGRGRGSVTVFEDERIGNVLGRPITPARPVTIAPDGSAFYEMRGFRVQVFAGNNQRISRDQAYARRDLIRDAFPEHEAEPTFQSPWWRLRVGNFETRDEAEEVMHEMRRRFPAFAREMTIVQDDVRIPVQQ
jgi:hypothetical protein